MRAQVTIEYLILSLVAISLITFSVMALAKIRDASMQAYDAMVFRSSADSIAKAMNQVCALGNGNQREVSLARSIKIEHGSNYAQFTDPYTGLSLVRETFCQTSYSGEVSGKIRVQNKEGKVLIS